jgi:hypothetical protein
MLFVVYVITKSVRRIRWAGSVARMEERKKMLTGYWWGNLKEGGHW